MVMIVCLVALLVWIYTPLQPVQRAKTRGFPQWARVGTYFLRTKISAPTRQKNVGWNAGSLAAETAAYMESGHSVAAAWKHTLGRLNIGEEKDRELDSFGVPPALRHVGDQQNIRGLSSIIAICRLSYTSGAPAALMLSQCAKGVSDSAQAESERHIALAGPISSVKLLAALPLAGVVFGYALGANPLAFLLGSPIGWLCLILGILCESCGIFWMRSLISRAKQGD